MKKSFLLLPIAVAVLSACSSSTSPAPVENADGTLSPGIMQPVDNTGSSGSWQPEIQQSSMPAGMDNPVASQPTMPAATAPATAVGNTATTPAVNTQPAVQTPAAPQTKTVCKTVTKPKPTAAQGSQNINIPRNATTNAPDYSKIDKGFYKGSTYTVNKGDTMFLIAYISGMDVKELAALNGMTSEPYNLKVGQTLKVANRVGGGAETETITEQQCTEVPVEQPAVTYTAGANGTQYGSDGTITGPVKAGAGTAGAAGAVAGPVVASAATSAPSPAYNSGVTAGVGTVAPATTGVVAGTASSAVQTPASNISWKWPTSGRVVQGFSNSDGGNKGIDISGSKGQPVYAAAAGRVVYAGNALRGYGNLIIIKHNDDFLSAYAHNDSISVNDQQEVKAGQQIAKMGSSGTNSTKLHFEIRYKGKSVDPTSYLPRR
ncbi:murein hydrolase activator NlpD [Basfia succiniciproducens]|uniref:murein hydrolase activator NlpD n=1 Tax=Basfia succiniciproducens TaxID=653940 RepID=UPI0008BFA64F|nr:murein hydrolase activator NlpD [Basfia succiniciproducens]SEQ21562.1 lipoprotein NlpD [Basfia succiniciproducens]